MQLGIFAKTFSRPTLSGILDAVQSHSLNCVQFNFTCVGLPTLPEWIDAGLVHQIRCELQTHKIAMAAVSGTFNLIHPDIQVRQDGLRRLKLMIATCRQLGTSIITLCTGTRDPENMWRSHPDNNSPKAWRDLLTSLSEVLSVAEASDVRLAFEPEIGNVLNSAQKGRRLLDEIKSSHLKVVMDGANLVQSGGLQRMNDTLTEAFALLGDDIAIAHAKDLDREGEMGNVPAGKGLLDYDHYLSLLRTAGFEDSLILHGLDEKDVAESVGFLRERLLTRHGNKSAV
jgi:sugar phosphate isomerase/epimerase